ARRTAARRYHRRCNAHVVLHGAGLRRSRGASGRDLGSVPRRSDRSRHGREREGAGCARGHRGGGLYGWGPRGGAGPLLRGRGRGDGGRVSGVLKLGTRGSRLALRQAEWVQAALARQGVAAELVVVKTRGDAEVDRPLRELAGKGFFTKEIEDELLGGRIDAAVHSLKDLPTRLPGGWALGAAPARAAPADWRGGREPAVPPHERRRGVRPRRRS